MIRGDLVHRNTHEMGSLNEVVYYHNQPPLLYCQYYLSQLLHELGDAGVVAAGHIVLGPADWVV